MVLRKKYDRGIELDQGTLDAEPYEINGTRKPKLLTS